MSTSPITQMAETRMFRSSFAELVTAQTFIVAVVRHNAILMRCSAGVFRSTRKTGLRAALVVIAAPDLPSTGLCTPSSDTYNAQCLEGLIIA